LIRITATALVAVCLTVTTVTAQRKTVAAKTGVVAVQISLASLTLSAKIVGIEVPSLASTVDSGEKGYGQQLCRLMRLMSGPPSYSEMP
jgi:hypothetical protein